MSVYNYDQRIAEQLRSFYTEELDSLDCKFDGVEGRISFTLIINPPIRSISCVVDIGTSDFVVYSYAPFRLDVKDKKKKKKLLNYISKVNYEIRQGCFQVDTKKTGEIRFKTYVNCKGEQNLTQDVIKESFYWGAEMFLFYGMRMYEILNGTERSSEAP